MHLDGLGTTPAALAVRGSRQAASRATFTTTLRMSSLILHVGAMKGCCPCVQGDHAGEGLEDRLRNKAELRCPAMPAPRLCLFKTAQPCLADVYHGLFENTTEIDDHHRGE
jgi:hypothetical protein